MPPPGTPPRRISKEVPPPGTPPRRMSKEMAPGATFNAVGGPASTVRLGEPPKPEPQHVSVGVPWENNDERYHTLERLTQRAAESTTRRAVHNHYRSETAANVAQGRTNMNRAERKKVLDRLVARPAHARPRCKYPCRGSKQPRTRRDSSPRLSCLSSGNTPLTHQSWVRPPLWVGRPPTSATCLLAA